MNSISPRKDFSRESSVTSLTLLERLKKNEHPAWERFVEIYSPLVYRLCRVSAVPADEAADVFQEVFRAVDRNIDSFRRDRPGDSFRAWLCTIIRSKIRDYFRRQAKRPKAIGGTDMMHRIDQIADLDLSSSIDGAVFDSDSSIVHRAIQSVRGEFEERTWAAFWKTTVEEISPVDVAELLGVSKWAVYQAKSRVLRRLRCELAELL
jgi:RNA polymerase sigma-70 factor (ECF subfamily)